RWIQPPPRKVPRGYLQSDVLETVRVPGYDAIPAPIVARRRDILVVKTTKEVVIGRTSRAALGAAWALSLPSDEVKEMKISTRSLDWRGLFLKKEQWSAVKSSAAWRKLALAASASENRSLRILSWIRRCDSAERLTKVALAVKADAKRPLRKRRF